MRYARLWRGPAAQLIRSPSQLDWLADSEQIPQYNANCQDYYDWFLIAVRADPFEGCRSYGFLKANGDISDGMEPWQKIPNYGCKDAGHGQVYFRNFSLNPETR